MFENTIFRDKTKSIYPLITTLVGLVVFGAVYGIVTMLGVITDLSGSVIAVLIPVLILYFILGILENRSLSVLAGLSLLFFFVAFYGGFIVGVIFSGSGMEGTIFGEYMMFVFTTVVFSVATAIYLYGRKGIVIFLIVSFIIGLLCNTPYFIPTIYEADITVYPLAIGIALGLGTGIYNRRSNI